MGTMKSTKNKLSITIFSIVIVPLLTNCVKNGYIEFYDDYTAGEVRPNKNSNPEVYGTSKNNIDEDVHRLQRDLYYVIGESFFMGASDRAHNVTNAAISKDADLVLVYEEYIGILRQQTQPCQYLILKHHIIQVQFLHQGVMEVIPAQQQHMVVGTSLSQ